MNTDTHPKDADAIVLSVLKAAYDAGTPGMYRADIYQRKECESIENIQRISEALNKLAKSGLVEKGPRCGSSGSLWSWISGSKAEPAPRTLPELAHKTPDKIDAVEYDGDGNLIEVTRRTDDAEPNATAPAMGDQAIDGEVLKGYRITNENGSTHMIQFSIDIPRYADIVIVGGTQVGKTIVLYKIAEMLRKEFGAHVIDSPDMHEDESGSSEYALQDWEQKLVRDTIWRMHEKNI